MNANNFTFKLLLVGDKGVGKTSFLKRLMGEKVSEEYTPTLGANIHSLNFPTTIGDILFKVWDIGDCDCSLHIVLGDCAIIMCDPNVKSSFENASHWKELIYKSCKNIPIVQCCNKVDKQRKPSSWETLPDVPYEELSSFTRENIVKPFIILANTLLKETNLEFTFTEMPHSPIVSRTKSYDFDGEFVAKLALPTFDFSGSFTKSTTGISNEFPISKQTTEGTASDMLQLFQDSKSNTEPEADLFSSTPSNNYFTVSDDMTSKSSFPSSFQSFTNPFTSPLKKSCSIKNKKCIFTANTQQNSMISNQDFHSTIRTEQTTSEHASSLDYTVLNEDKISLGPLMKLLDEQLNENGKIYRSLQKITNAYEGWELIYAQNKEDDNFTKVEESHLYLDTLISKFESDYGVSLEEFLEFLNRLQKLPIIPLFHYSLKYYYDWKEDRKNAQSYLSSIEEIKKTRTAYERDSMVLRHKLELGKLEKSLLKHQEEEIQKSIQQKMDDITALDLKEKDLLEKIKLLKYSDVQKEAERIIQSQNLQDLTEEENDIEKIRRFIVENQKWSNNDLTCYRGGKIVDNVYRLYIRKTPELETILLKRISLEGNRDVAWNEISTLMKLQSKASAIELKGAYIVDEKELVIEMSHFGVGSLMNWLKCIDIQSSSSMNLTTKDLKLSKTVRSEKELFRMLLHVIEAVVELHTLGIEHRDITPENIFVDEEGQVRLINFGYSCDTALPVPINISAKDRNISSSFYVPPEWRVKRVANHIFGSWDVYSLGIVMFEVLCDPKDLACIEVLDGKIYPKDVLPKTGHLRDWIHELVLSLLHPQPNLRPSCQEVARQMKQVIFDSYIEIARQLEENSQNVFQALSDKMRKKIVHEYTSTTVIRKENICENVISLFAKIPPRPKRLKLIPLTIEGETGVGDGVFKDVCEWFWELLFSNEESYLHFDNEYQVFTARDDIELEKEMTSIGKLLYYMVASGFITQLKFSPLLYCVLVDKIPKTANSVLEIYSKMGHKYVSNILRWLGSSSTAERENALETVSTLKKNLLGSKTRMANFMHIRNGFTCFMYDDEKQLLKQLEWTECELLCSGPKIISNESVISLLEASFEKPEWNNDRAAIQTRKWFMSWLSKASSDDLRNFLRLATGLSTIPHYQPKYQIDIYPTKQYLHSQVCFNQLGLGIDCKDEATLHERLDTAISNFCFLED